MASTDVLPFLPVSVSRKRCVNCGAYFALEEAFGELCLYHPGRYAAPEHAARSLSACVKRWECCGAPSEDAPGCRRSPHCEDQSSMQAQVLFDISGLQQQQRPLAHAVHRAHPHANSVPPIPAELLNPPELAAERAALEASRALDTAVLSWQARQAENRSRSNAAQRLAPPRQDAQASAAAGYIVVPVGPHDTLQGLALRHGVTVGVLKRMNGIVRDDELMARACVRVPSSPGVEAAVDSQVEAQQKQWDPQTEEEKAQRHRALLASKFLQRCTGALKEEAQSYLSLAGWDLERAVAAFAEDERAAPLPPTSLFAKTSVKAKRCKSKKTGCFGKWL